MPFHNPEGDSHKASPRRVKVAPEARNELLALDAKVRDGLVRGLEELEAGRASGQRLLSAGAGALTGELFAIRIDGACVLYVVSPARFSVVGIMKRRLAPAGLDRRLEKMRAHGGESLADVKVMIAARTAA